MQIIPYLCKIQTLQEEMDWMNLILFELAGRPVLLMDLVSSVLGLACVFLAGRNSKYNFWVGYLYTAALFFLFWNRSLYANLLLQPISLAINILGHYRWTHPSSSERSSEDRHKLRVSMLSWGERILHLRVGNVFMPIVCSLYLINGLWSLASWMKLYRRNS